MKNSLVCFLIFVTNFVFAQVDTVVFPDNFMTEQDYIDREGDTLLFRQSLVVSDNYQWQQYGRLKLSSLRLFSPTDVAIPLSEEYRNIVAHNAKNWIYLDNGSSATYPNPIPFADENGTRRTGSRVNNLKVTLHRRSWGWVLNPVPDTPPVFYGNPRPNTPDITSVHNLKVCSFNLEYYLANNYGTGYGPNNEAEAAVQHNKIMRALETVDADIYGLVEIQTGQAAIQKLCNALNSRSGGNIYSFIDDRTNTSGTYTKVGFIYRNDKVRPVGSLSNNNTSVRNRKKSQCFELISNSERFIFSLNHFKSKSGNGTGRDADQNDGQGAYNQTRIAEANSVVTSIESYKTQSRENDVLLMGDFNAYSKEDPMQVFYNNNYLNVLKRNSADSAYSYLYRGTVGCIDHILANQSMAEQITETTVFHINADEPAMFEYNRPTVQSNMYRSSDHDILMAAINLGTYSGCQSTKKDTIKIYPTGDKNIIVENAKNQWLTLYDISGKQLLYLFIKEDNKIINLSNVVQNAGIYIFVLDDMRSSKVKSYKVVL